MPRPRPETTTMPPSPSAAARSRQNRRPLAEALRAPTTATIGLPSNSARPSTVKIGGASAIRQAARVGRLAPADELCPETLQCGELGLGLGACDRGHGLGALPAPRELRDHFQRRAGGTEAAQQSIKADRADGLGAAQPQPVEALLRIEFACGQCVPQLLPKEIRLSVPASSRRIFAWCRAMINNAIPAISSAVALSATIAASAAPATAATSAAREE